MPLRVLLAERLPLVSALLRDILAAIPGITVVGEVSEVENLVPRTILLLPDLVLLDWTFGGLSGLQTLRALRPAPKVIVTVSGGDRHYCAAVLAHGGAACLTREYLHREVPAAVQQIIEEHKNETIY